MLDLLARLFEIVFGIVAEFFIDIRFDGDSDRKPHIQTLFSKPE